MEKPLKTISWLPTPTGCFSLLKDLEDSPPGPTTQSSKVQPDGHLRLLQLWHADKDNPGQTVGKVSSAPCPSPACHSYVEGLWHQLQLSSQLPGASLTLWLDKPPHLLQEGAFLLQPDFSYKPA